MTARIAEKNLERRAKRCHGFISDALAKDAALAVELLRAAAVWAEWLLGGRGYVAARFCRAAAAAVLQRWMDPRHALRFAHEHIEEAARPEDDG